VDKSSFFPLRDSESHDTFVSSGRNATMQSGSGNGKVERNGSNARSPNQKASRSQDIENVAEEVALETETHVRLIARKATPEWIPKVH
jgi:hypothetical protein